MQGRELREREAGNASKADAREEGRVAKAGERRANRREGRSEGRRAEERGEEG
jgi:hypothetical protein